MYRLFKYPEIAFFFLLVICIVALIMLGARATIYLFTRGERRERWLEKHNRAVMLIVQPSALFVIVLSAMLITGIVMTIIADGAAPPN
jgi:hypothetical protein